MAVEYYDHIPSFAMVDSSDRRCNGYGKLESTEDYIPQEDLLNQWRRLEAELPMLVSIRIFQWVQSTKANTKELYRDTM